MREPHDLREAEAQVRQTPDTSAARGARAVESSTVGCAGTYLAVMRRAHASCRAEQEVEIIESWHATEPMWIYVRWPGSTMPAQGWKLHVSATLSSAQAVLERALPVLLTERVSFKVAASPRVLSGLNQGESGYSQIGKFITVYPQDDEQAVRLGRALDRASRGLPCPPVPTDRRLARESCVFYRYGTFGDQCMQLSSGEVVPAMLAPDGTPEPDRRAPRYTAPIWARDPFAAAGFGYEEAPIGKVVQERYIPIKAIHASPRGAVYLAVDMGSPRVCVLKTAVRHTMMGPDGNDAQDRLRNEAAVLRALAVDPRMPRVYDLVEHDTLLALAMEDVAGVTLEQHIVQLAQSGRFAGGEQIASWGRELADILAAVHAHGYVYGDLKSSNVILTRDGQLRLVDFELARSARGSAFGHGTRGYMSPQQAAGHAPAYADDVYSLGALLFFAASRAEPSLAPQPHALLRRPLSLLNPAIGPDLERIIRRCLAPEPAARYARMEEVAAALALLGRRAGAQPASTRRAAVLPMQRYAVLARRLGATLCRAATPIPGQMGMTWSSASLPGARADLPNLNTGSAGCVLALAELVAAHGGDGTRAVLRQGAEGLFATPHVIGPPMPGLYVGAAGRGVALLRAGQVLGDHTCLHAACSIGEAIAKLPYGAPDLFTGTAGRLRFHVLLWEATGDARHLTHALQAGEALLHAGTINDQGERWWRFPAGYEALSEQAFLGYAHGAAGCADALLDLYQATGAARFLQAALGAAQWLQRLARPALADGSGLNWPSVEDGEPADAFWCHGAAGIGRFFLHLSQLAALPEADELAWRAALTVAHSTRWASPVFCHGLAGNIEFLLDMAQLTGEQVHRRAAYLLARLLAASALTRDGQLVWAAEMPEAIRPDLLVGYSGVLLCLLRLADPELLATPLHRLGVSSVLMPARTAALS